MRVELIQNTPEWLAWRRKGIGGSDAPIIMGVSPWRTAYQLWLDKTGRSKSQKENAAMRRGHDLEPKARAAYEFSGGDVMQPCCIQDDELPWLRGSMDGLNFDESLALEIKCPGAEDHETAKAGSVPDKYIPQCDHLLAVSGAKELHYWSFDGFDGILVIHERNPDRIAKLLEAESAFWECVTSNTPPEISDDDVIERDDAPWIEAATVWRSANEALKNASQAEKDARSALVAIAGSHPKLKGSGITLTRSFRAGNVDYKKVPELAGINLDTYRKAGTEVVTIKEIDNV